MLRWLLSAHQHPLARWLQMQRDMDLPKLSTPADAWQFAQQLLRLYARSLHLYMGLDPKDKGPADDLIVMALEGVLRCGAATQTPQSQQQHQQQELGASERCNGVQHAANDHEHGQQQAGRRAPPGAKPAQTQRGMPSEGGTQAVQGAHEGSVQQGQDLEGDEQAHSQQLHQQANVPATAGAPSAAQQQSAGTASGVSGPDDWLRQQQARQVAILRALLLCELGQQRVTHTAALRLAATALCGLAGEVLQACASRQRKVYMCQQPEQRRATAFMSPVYDPRSLHSLCSGLWLR